MCLKRDPQQSSVDPHPPNCRQVPTRLSVGTDLQLGSGAGRWRCRPGRRRGHRDRPPSCWCSPQRGPGAGGSRSPWSWRVPAWASPGCPCCLQNPHTPTVSSSVSDPESFFTDPGIFSDPDPGKRNLIFSKAITKFWEKFLFSTQKVGILSLFSTNQVGRYFIKQ